MKSDDIKTEELLLPPWKFCGVSIFGEVWRLHVFYDRKCVQALHGETWSEVLERAKDWAAKADVSKFEGDA